MTRRIVKTVKIFSVIELILSIAFAVYAFFLINRLHDKVWFEYKNKKIEAMSVLWSVRTAAIIVISVLAVLTTLLVTVRFIKSEKQTHEMYKKPFKIAWVCAGIWVVIILIFICTNSNDLRGEKDYDFVCYEYSNGQHTIVIQEGNILGPSGTVYQIMDDNEAVTLDAIFLSHRSDSSDDYDVKWYDDKADITVDHGWNGKETVTVTFRN
jgi:hypothetical protein